MKCTWWTQNYGLFLFGSSKNPDFDFLHTSELRIRKFWIDNCKHVKYTCQPPRNGVAVLSICKYPYFNPTYDYVASFSKVLGGGFECLPLSELLEFVSHQIKG